MSEKNRWTYEQVKDMIGDDVTSLVIPVNRVLKAEQQILNFWYVEEILKKADKIAVGECFCRKKFKNCDHTLEGCLYLNDWAVDAIREGYAKKSSIANALAILIRTYKDGLVLVSGGEDPPVKICSCCSCCCFLFAGLQFYNMERSLARSGFKARVNEEECAVCKTCVSRCHFGAMTLNSEKVVFTPEKCFGCGLCISTCPTNAIELVKKNI